MSETPGVAPNRPEGDRPATVADRTAPGEGAPGTNQGKTEPIRHAAGPHDDEGMTGSADPTSVAPGDAHRQVDEHGDAPPGALADDDQTGAARTAPGTPPDSLDLPPVPAPGDAPGLGSVSPSVQAAQGTSEESAEVTGIRATGYSAANAVPGKPDGEVDTRA